MEVILDDPPDCEPRFIGKRPALSRPVSTVGERWPRSFERLRTPEDLGRRLVEAVLLDAQRKVRRSEVKDARVLRESIYRVARPAAAARPTTPDVDEIVAWAATSALAPQLTSDPRGVRWTAEGPVAAALANVARVDLLSGPLVSRLRECAASDCALLCGDSSRTGRRRLCSMSGCGNRSKTAADRQRQAAEPGKGP